MVPGYKPTERTTSESRSKGGHFLQEKVMNKVLSCGHLLYQLLLQNIGKASIVDESWCSSP